jgi:hypothetical protein
MANKEIVRLLGHFRNSIIDECTRAADKAWPKNNYSMASENSDIYRAQDHAVEGVIKAIQKLKRQHD